ncbi:unnamed protein product [Clavelina lepadiformis]|uniref:Uncharacterized protein n=1 Tax=Clavelina lepadiformis TaxID=159417 RepID=A0ABP0F988_CLALP
MNESIAVNVGGEIFRVMSHQMNNFPKCRLTKLFDHKYLTRTAILELCDDYNPRQTAVTFFFDRDPQSFRFIMSAFRGHLIHASKSVCMARLSEEMVYWSVAEAWLDNCCRLRLEECLSVSEKYEKDMDIKLERYLVKQEKLTFISPIGGWKDLTQNWESVKKYVWKTVEDPTTSTFAKIWMFISISFILLSLTIFVIGTVDGYYTIDENEIEVEINVLEGIETVCMAWFTFEYVVRLTAAPKKFKFCRQILNIVDLLTIIPFFVQLLWTGGHWVSIHTWKHISQMLRIMRVMRVFRLGRHSGGLKLLCSTLYDSTNELAMLSIYLLIGIVVLASVVYATDQHIFANLGEATWFAAVTITTVGYGDFVPQSLMGKIITSLSFLLGLFGMAMPIHPIISNFSNCYRTQRNVELAFKRLLRMRDNKEKDALQEIIERRVKNANRFLEASRKETNEREAKDNIIKTSSGKQKSKTLKRAFTSPMMLPQKRMSKSAKSSRSLSLKSTPSTALQSNEELLPLPEARAGSSKECHCIFCTD